MISIIFSERARRDMIAIGRYIAQDPPKAATNLIREFHKSASQLLDFLRLGQEHVELGNGRRYLVIKNYLMIYRMLSNGNIRILRVVHGSRYLPGLV